MFTFHLPRNAKYKCSCDDVMQEDLADLKSSLLSRLRDLKSLPEGVSLLDSLEHSATLSPQATDNSSCITAHRAAICSVTTLLLLQLCALQTAKYVHVAAQTGNESACSCVA